MSSISISLDNPIGEYKPGAKVLGALHIATQSSVSHNGIVVTGAGQIGVRPSKSAFGGNASRVPPVTLMDFTLEVRPAGRLSEGSSRVDFEFYVLGPKGCPLPLLESYCGACLSIQYLLHAEVRTAGTFFAKAIRTCMEIVVLVPGQGFDPDEPPQDPGPCLFSFDNNSFEGEKFSSEVVTPKLEIEGQLSTTLCEITRPITGTLTVKHCQLKVVTIDIYLIRVEGLQMDGKIAYETSYVQTTQIACADVCRGVPIPIHMVLPRVFTCPKLVTDTFRVLWQVEIVIFFEEEGASVRKVFPIQIFRAAKD
jgi:hypothetical protein